MPTPLQPALGLLMQHLPVVVDGFEIIGLKIRTTNRIEAVPETAKIPALWRRFKTDKVSAQIAGIPPDAEPVAVYTEYRADHHGPYSLILGHKVGSRENIPSEMASAQIRPGRYLRFSTEGKKPGALFDAWKTIWSFFKVSHRFERAYTADFEIHGGDHIEIFVAIEE